MRGTRIAAAFVTLAACTQPLPETATLRGDPAPPAARSPSPSPSVERSPSPDATPRFRATIHRIDDETRARMRYSYRRGCPVPLSRLRLIRLTHWDFDREVRAGELVVHADAARAMVRVFRKLFDARFPIARVRLVDAYRGDDDRSMAANNTSAFNCRRATGGSRWSQHAYGRAIDVNPVQNPYVAGRDVRPPAGRRYLDRTRRARGMIRRGDAVARAFSAEGWGWGGDFRSIKDYQHFSSTGR